jgi:hypothetical protein
MNAVAPSCFFGFHILCKCTNDSAFHSYSFTISFVSRELFQEQYGRFFNQPIRHSRRFNIFNCNTANRDSLLFPLQTAKPNQGKDEHKKYVYLVELIP